MVKKKITKQLIISTLKNDELLKCGKVVLSVNII